MESKHNAEINQRIMDAAELLDRDAFSITEWDESMIRQMVDTVKVMSKNKIIVTLKGGAEIKDWSEQHGLCDRRYPRQLPSLPA